MGCSWTALQEKPSLMSRQKHPKAKPPTFLPQIQQPRGPAPTSSRQGRPGTVGLRVLEALGPIADYAGDHKLLHFVFDLTTWSDIGGALRGMPMWQPMKGAVWAPQYWKVRHAAALDMQAQCVGILGPSWPGPPLSGPRRQHLSQLLDSDTTPARKVWRAELHTAAAATAPGNDHASPDVRPCS